MKYAMSEPNEDDSKQSTQKQIHLADLAVPVFAFYLLIACNFLPEIVGCRLKTILHNSMIAKHIIAIILLFFLVVTVNPTLSSGYIRAVLITLGVYMWFFATTRSSLPVVFVTVALLLAIYVLNLVRTQLEASKDDVNAARCETAQKWIARGSIVISFVGFVSYFISKRIEYGHTFTLMKFVVGSKQCRGTNTRP